MTMGSGNDMTGMTMDGDMMEAGSDDDFEIGLGITVSLFDNLLSFTFGYNLQGESGGSRNFVGWGLSISEVVNKFKKE